MKTTYAVLALAVTAGLAAAAGYGLGRAPTMRATDAAAALPTGAAAPARKLLYYRNPMGLPDTSPEPKKDPMGMDYVPVYEGDDADTSASANQVKISVEKVQKLGVRTQPAEMREVTRAARALGRIEIDERRVAAIAPKFEGWIDRLHVNTTGQAVARGEALFDVYSPELVSAQREYAIAAASAERLRDADPSAQASMNELAKAAQLRLRNWDISDAQIEDLAKNANAARRTLTYRSPIAGVVIEKKALQGMRFGPGDTLYQIADLSSVWVIADVYEQDIGAVKVGQKTKITIAAYPGEEFTGKVSYIYPTLKAETRTVPVRIELPNPAGRLKPGLFAAVELRTGRAERVLAVPGSAIIDSGVQQIALVQVGEGRFEPRVVKLGARSDADVQVLDGVREGEQVVVAANFLIDAESNLKAAVGNFGHAEHGVAAPKEAGAAESPSASAPATTAAPASVGATAEGRIEGIDAQAGTITLAHGPIAALKWPAMTMDFVLANGALAKDLRTGDTVSADIVERKPGEWVVTRITRRVAAPAHAASTSTTAPAAEPAHTGH